MLEDPDLRVRFAAARELGKTLGRRTTLPNVVTSPDGRTAVVGDPAAPGYDDGSAELEILRAAARARLGERH